MADFNIKISELDPFTSPRSTEDFFPLVDSSSMTTYRATISDIGSLMSHSISSDTASLAFTASYVSSSIIDGIVTSALYANSASHAVLSDTASFLQYSGVSNGTASYALTSSVSFTASFVQYTAGVSNGSASYALSASNAVSASYATSASNADSASCATSASNAVSASYATSSSNTVSASYANTASFAIVSGYDFIYPYIKEITFTSSYDDYVNLNFIGCGWQYGTYGQCGAQGFLGGDPVRARWFYDPNDVVYRLETMYHVSEVPIAPTPIVSIPPVQTALIWDDNRGDHAQYWFFVAGSKFRLKVAITPTIDITHVYTPLYYPDPNYSYHYDSYLINAHRARLGLNAIQSNYSLLGLGTIVNMFSSFTIE